MTIVEAIRNIEAGRKIQDGFKGPSIGGDPFITLCSGGIKPEGGVYPLLCSSEEIAVMEFVRAFWRYTGEVLAPADGEGGWLYWREKPNVEMFRMTLMDSSGTHRIAENRYIMYARLLVSDRGPQDSHG